MDFLVIVIYRRKPFYRLMILPPSEFLAREMKKPTLRGVKHDCAYSFRDSS